MKKHILIILCILFNIYTYSQINLVHTYDSASTIYGKGQLMVIDFEVSGERYVKINKMGKYISIYEMNHSLVKTISYANFPLPTNNLPSILYFSEKLFDLDDKIEFMYLYVEDPNTYHTLIYNEDGNLLFSADSMSPQIILNMHLQQYPIYNTSQGTMLILSCQTDQAKVFSLPGTLSTAIAEANGQLMQVQGGQGQFSNLYPNPSNGAITLQYQLPKGEQYGEIVLYNTQGTEVKRYKVDNTFNDIIVDNTMLPSGTYYYQLQTSKGAVGTKKMVVVK